MILTIITINWNNAAGLHKTMSSVLAQSCQDFEYIVVDGASTDGSVDVIKQYLADKRLRWISEPDKGIYNAMNKGIRLANGDYLQFLNSGDTLIDEQVVDKMYAQLNSCNYPDIVVGRMSRLMDDGTILPEKHFVIGNRHLTINSFYFGSVNHPPSYIRRNLFDQFGLYDESLRIVSDWKWFLQVIGLNDVQPFFVPIDVALFEMSGISITNSGLRNRERRRVLYELLPKNVIADYDHNKVSYRRVERIKRHQWAYNLFCLLDRFLFKIEKWKD